MLNIEDRIRERMLSIIASIPKSTSEDMRAMAQEVKQTARYANANAEEFLETVISKLPSHKQWDNDK